MMACVRMLLCLGGAVLIAVAVVSIALRERPADAVGHPIYTLPFFQESHITCGWGPYYLCGLPGWHNGTDYSVGSNTGGGEDVVAAMDGTAYHHTDFDPITGLGCGNYVVIAHGNGHRSRYCHLSVIIVAHGNVISRGQVVGREGLSGATAVNLHFDVRQGGTNGGDCCGGTSVDPYGGVYSPGTYSFILNPPVFASRCFWPVDSSAGPGRVPGVFRPAQNHYAGWHLKYTHSGGNADHTFNYGDTCDIPITGDWDGNGTDTPGIFRPYGATGTEWHLRNSNSPGGPYTVFTFGTPTDYPVVGDWNGVGITNVGIFRPSGTTGPGEWHLKNFNGQGGTMIPVFKFGEATDRPIVGDWDGSGGGGAGSDTIGVFRPSTAGWHLRNSNTAGLPSIPAFVYGNGNPQPDHPVTGDFNWDGIDTYGIYRPKIAAASQWKLRNVNFPGSPDLEYPYGVLSDKALTGDWN
jgi:hypothetical protein